MSQRARVAIQLTLEGAQVVSSGLHGVAAGVGTVATGFERASATAFHFIQLGKDVIGMARRMAVGVRGFGDALLDPNIAREDMVGPFETVIGDADEAARRLEELYSTARRRPWTGEEMVEGAKNLHLAGGALLSTGQNLHMVQEMAMGAGRGFSEMSDTVARFYTDLQAGDPVRRSARQLQQLGLLTADEVVRLRELQESGASVNQMWAAFQDVMQKTSGSIQRNENDMSNLRATMSGLWSETRRLVGVRLFESIQSDMVGMRDDWANLFDTGQMDAFAAKYGEMIHQIYSRVKEMVIGSLNIGDVVQASIDGDMFSGLRAGLGSIASNFWQQMVHWGRMYAPEIQSMLVPRRLHGMLGIDTNEPMEARRERIGDPRRRDPGIAFQAAARGYDVGWAQQLAGATPISHTALMQRPYASTTVASGNLQQDGMTTASMDRTANHMQRTEQSAAELTRLLQEAARNTRRLNEQMDRAARSGARL